MNQTIIQLKFVHWPEFRFLIIVELRVAEIRINLTHLGQQWDNIQIVGIVGIDNYIIDPLDGTTISLIDIAIPVMCYVGYDFSLILTIN
jgi:hypothetical protein